MDLVVLWPSNEILALAAAAGPNVEGETFVAQAGRDPERLEKVVLSPTHHRLA